MKRTSSFTATLSVLRLDMFHFCDCHSFLPVCTVAKTALVKNAYITYSFDIMEVSVPSIAIGLYRLTFK